MAMNRKAVWVLTLLLVACINRAEAQQQGSNIPEIGILRVDASTSPAAIESIISLKQGLTSLGYVDGQNVTFVIRGADNKLDRLPLLASELVKLKVDIIVTGEPQATRAVKEATSTTPIVMGRMG